MVFQGAGLGDGGARGRGDGDEARQPETGDGGQGHDRQVSRQVCSIYQISNNLNLVNTSQHDIYSPLTDPIHLPIQPVIGAFSVRISIDSSNQTLKFLCCLN